eukprot:6349953-Amphidinium_carterae.1
MSMRHVPFEGLWSDSAWGRWGIKFLGFSFGLGINAAGSVTMTETTYAKALGMKPGDDLQKFNVDSRTVLLSPG